jgi:ABC-type Mn2+/Zn2+ transport system permease subunit
MQLILALLIGVFIGGAAGYLGTLMLSQRMALVAGPLGHLTLPGIALAFVFGFDVSLCAFPFVILGVFLIWLFEVKTGLPMEALTAIVFALGVAITFLFMPEEKTIPALIGDVSQISLSATAATLILSLLIIFVTKIIYQRIVLAGISEDLVKVEGVDLRKTNLIYLVCIALMVAIGVRIVGSLMIAALVAIPACTSRNLSNNLLQYSYGGMISGSLACALGILISNLTGITVGPLIIITSSSFFIVSTLFKR